MKTNITRVSAALLAVGICIWSSAILAQTATTTVTTANGAFTEYVPGSETMVVKSETGTTPLRYSVTKQTTIVDESGAPVAVERISPGSQLAIQYTGTGDRLVASRIVVHKASAAVNEPVTTTRGATVNEPVTTTGPAAVTEQHTTTTTAETRPLTHEEKHAIHEEKEHQRKAAKKEIEREKDALDKAKDKIDDED